jgi:hypothetical protein
MESKRVVTVQLGEGLHNRARQLAAANEMSLSGLVRSCLKARVAMTDAVEPSMGGNEGLHARPTMVEPAESF